MGFSVISAENRTMVSGFLPLVKNSLGYFVVATEPLIDTRVRPRNHKVIVSRSKGHLPCHSRTSFSPSQPVQALQLAATPLANKRSVAVPSVLVPLPSQAAACFRARPSVPAQTYLPANRVPYAATKLNDAFADTGSASQYHNTDPAQPMLMRGFSVSSRPKGTVHVQ
jgi:hypothetical protein